MTAIAFIGGDGAGKTTLLDEIVERNPNCVKYLYMGINASSSNFALPSTRLMYASKVRKEKARRRQRGEDASEPISLHGIGHRSDKRGPVWATARLANRVAEEIFRQIVSWSYQLRGYVVLYDRHFLFDFTSMSEGPRRLTDRLHVWFLEKVYPKPHLSIFLDAPSELLYSRKPEVPVHYLDERRAAFLSRGSTLRNFVIVDASQSEEDVYDDAIEAVGQLLDQRRAPWRVGSRRSEVV